MDKQKCIKALLDNLYEVYLQEGTIEKYQSHIQWAFKEAINNMRCFFKNDSFSCEFLLSSKEPSLSIYCNPIPVIKKDPRSIPRGFFAEFSVDKHIIYISII